MSDLARRTTGSSPAEPVDHPFEAAWRAGQQPAIEHYLPDTPLSTRAEVFRELLRLDLAYRISHHEKPTVEEYCVRFPDLGELIRAVFGDTPTGGRTPQPSSLPTASPATKPALRSIPDWPAVPNYEILGQLEPGGMGVVYQARQLTLNRIVALKMIRTGVHAGAQERARFRVEAEAVASLSHPHIIQIYEYGEWKGMPYLAMEFAEGGSLAARLAGRPLPSSEAAQLVETLARAVHFVHERGLIHRDLKPANILLQRLATDEHRLTQIKNKDAHVPGSDSSSIRVDLGSSVAHFLPKLADFGLAKRLHQDQGLTQTQAVLGTASYMAPEQAKGNKETIGPAADTYALGAILYELLTGQPPFLAETHELTIHHVLSVEPVPPTQRQPDVPPELEAICLKCLEKEPGERFASALALAEDLHRYQDGEPISIQSIGPFEWHARLARRAGYEIDEILWVGPCWIVYKAQHLRLKRPVALMILALRGRLNADQQARLRAAIEARVRLHHPNLFEVYDFGELSGEPFIAAEYVEGRSLADGLAVPLKPAEQTAALVETLARAMHYAHQQGILDCGLKPSKVLLKADGTLKILRLGLVRLLCEVLPECGPKGAPLALSSYMAPEQAEQRMEATSPATDVYALGAILYEQLTGRPPVLADTVRETLEQVRLVKPDPPRHLRPEVPRGLEAICLKCLEKEPARRYPSAAALAEDLRRFRAGEVLFIDDLDELPQQERWARRAGYEILEVLGRGRDSFTYKARQVVLNRIVVLKRIAAELRFVPAAKARFRWEAHLLAGLRHPNIVQLYDQGEQSDLAYFAREFVDGCSLAEMAAKSPLPVPRAVELASALARTIQAIHARGAVHGGLNPGNVYLTPAGIPKITSLQKVRLPGTGSEDRSENELRRLACYLAPEQLAARNRMLDPATDIYALGAILYTLLAGQPPFVGPTLSEVLEQVRTQAPVSPRQWQPAIPLELEALCLTCLEKQRRRRPASPAALADELRLFLT